VKQIVGRKYKNILSNFFLFWKNQKEKTYENWTGKVISMSAKHNIGYIYYYIFNPRSIGYGHMMTDKNTG
jgi:hypothetical protein